MTEDDDGSWPGLRGEPDEPRFESVSYDTVRVDADRLDTITIAYDGAEYRVVAEDGDIWIEEVDGA